MGMCLSTHPRLHQLGDLVFPLASGPVHANVLAAGTTVSEGTLQQEEETAPAARGHQNRRSASHTLLSKSLLCVDDLYPHSL